MLRFLVFALVAGGALHAAVWPDTVAGHKRRSATPVPITSNQAVWDEYGLQEAEAADFGTFRATAYRFKDGTGAFAASQWLNAPVVANYVVSCKGRCPTPDRLAANLPDTTKADIPNLSEYLPKANLRPGSQRYVLGPAALALFAPGVSPDAAAFQFGTEGQVADYQGPAGDASLVLLAYPTPGFARQQLAQLQKTTNAAVKRAGPLVALALSSDSAAAQDLLKQVHYQATVTIDDQVQPHRGVPATPQNVGKMILSIMTLAGIVLAFCALSGLVFGSLRLLAQRFGIAGAQDGVIALHLQDK